MGWLSAIDLLSMGWLWAIYGLAIGWLWVGYGLAMGWLWTGYGWAMGLLWWAGYQQKYISTAIYRLAIRYLSAGYQLAISWLSAGYQLVMAQNQYTAKPSHMLLDFWLCSLDGRTTWLTDGRTDLLTLLPHKPSVTTWNKCDKMLQVLQEILGRVGHPQTAYFFC